VKSAFILSFAAMSLCRLTICLGFFFSIPWKAISQRSYQPNSVLATGTWYKIAVSNPGIYKIDIAFLNALGISTSNLPSNTIRLFGNGGQMLSESNAGPWTDDLQENAIMIVDGGDGVLNGSDHILFYASGPHQWIKDSANSRFTHKKNIYSDKAYYFLSVGGNGKRVANSPVISSATVTVNSFGERYFHELDSVNFLASGKEWFGEEFSDMPGRTTVRNFAVNIPNVPLNSSATLATHCVARSVGGASRFDVRVNTQNLGQININAISGSQYDLFAQQSTSVFNTILSQNNISVGFTYFPGSFNSQAWLNWFELFCRRSLSLSGADQLLFRDWLSVGPGNKAEFVISNSNSTTQVWDITDPLNPLKMQGNLSGTDYRFVNDAVRLREYVAFNSTNLLAPAAVGRITNQNLHNTSAADYIIVSYPAFLAQAQRLAQIHQQRNSLRAVVVTTDQVFNEFGGGSPDATTIRDYVKMYHDKYGSSVTDKPKYLLLFGDASYDFKDRLSNNTNYVPAWENNFSLDPLSTYTSDDYYGFLDDNEDINAGVVINYLDLGIGRVPAKNNEEAKNFVDKLEAYFSQASLGPWRNNLTFIADDEDGNLHFQDGEILTATAANASPIFNQQKIYLDAFQQESGAGGSRYPLANQAINNQVYNGTLIWNYNGHGGAKRLAEETVLDQEIVNNWNNPNRLPLFITATCDFAPYDNPSVNSIGENILMRPRTGGIALMTTTRVVFAFSNRIMNDNYLRFALQPDANGRYKSLGDAVKEAKNYTYQTSGDITNNRKFTLLGDPALTLAFPLQKLRVTRVNGIPVSQADTLSSTERVTIDGEVTDQQGNLLNNFTGSVYSIVFDKPQTVNTLGNDATSQVAPFQTQTNILFKGKASVSNGQFSFSFKVPKDINYQFGNGKLSLYAENGTIDAASSFTNFIIGGTGNNAGNDTEGPQIKPFLNDEKFVNGRLTNENPVLIVKLADSSGINTVGTGIGHDIVVTLDDDNRQYFILNDFYESDPDSYQKGVARFQLPALEPGPHSIRIKAWDVLNNSNETVLEFIVANDEALTLSHVLNYPNPFSTRTQFWFEHNKPGQNLYVSVQVFSLSGRIIKMIQQTINTAGNRSSELEWNGRDEYGDKVGRGVYLYKLTVTSQEGQKKEKIEKLVVF
ncbi:MAG TPA: type IX secretion system sortase PorU, partial [Chitinophagaceae bacterium]